MQNLMNPLVTPDYFCSYLYTDYENVSENMCFTLKVYDYEELVGFTFSIR